MNIRNIANRYLSTKIGNIKAQDKKRGRVNHEKDVPYEDYADGINTMIGCKHLTFSLLLIFILPALLFSK